MTTDARSILWWGRSNPDYARNRIVRAALGELGWTISDFRPTLSAVGGLEADLRRVATPDLVWVPCFRQRDLAAAARFAERRGVPLVFDPLISAYDKQVFERDKYAEGSAGAERVRRWERELFQAADLVLADTAGHAQFYGETFDVPEERLAVVPVGAEEPLFHPAPMPRRDGGPLEILFCGTFIGLQGPETVVDAAHRYAGPPVRWTLLGDGPLLPECRRRAQGLADVTFEPWLEYAALPGRIRRADILLGIFGVSGKAGRVIPNKAYQAMACGRPLITRESGAWPAELRESSVSGVCFVDPGNAQALADAVARWASQPERLDALGAAAAESYRRYFSNRIVCLALSDALGRLFP